MIKLMAMLTLLASAQNAVAPAPAAAASEPRQIADNAMQFVAANDMKGLFELIGRHMPMDPKDLDKSRANIVEQRKRIPDALGKSLGYAFISECRSPTASSASFTSRSVKRTSCAGSSFSTSRARPGRCHSSTGTKI